MTGEQVLAVPMEPDTNDAEANTIQEYLVTLLRVLWTDGEGFSGKRPLGNSGWRWDLYSALVRAGALPGKLDEDGSVEDCDLQEARQLILLAIQALGCPAL